MANKRLIDANAYAFSVDLINEPTVDAVDVVRCQDCKWAEFGKDYAPYCNHLESGLYATIKDDDFCSYGERKEKEV